MGSYDLEEIKEQQEMAKVIGEISQYATTIALKPKLDEAEKVLKNETSTKEQKAQAEQVVAKYG